MKKPIFVIVILLIIAVSASGQERPAPRIFANYGPAALNTPMLAQKVWSGGRTSGFGLVYPVNQMISVVANLNYTTFKFEEEGVRSMFPKLSELEVSGGPVKFYSATMNLRITPRIRKLPLRLYLEAGAGYFRGSGDVINGLEILPWDVIPPLTGTFYSFNPNQTVFNMDAGVGASMGLKNGASVYVEATYITAFFENQRLSYIPFRLGFVTPLRMFR